MNTRVTSSTLRITRHVLRTECPWLKRDYVAGETVFRYWGATYGCVSPSGTPVTIVEGEIPFFELPNDALEISGDDS